MGFVVWYQLSFLGSQKNRLLRVSNDVLHGDFLVDADISTEARLGPHAAKFSLTLHDLPRPAVDRLAERHRASTKDTGPLLVDIRLGYFDQPATQQTSVMLGAVTEITATVSAEGELLAVVSGEEITGHRLLHTPFDYSRAGSAELKDLLAGIEAAAKARHKVAVPVVGPEVTGQRRDLTERQGNALGALGKIASAAGKRLAVGDGKAVVGKEPTEAPPAKFSAETNIVQQGQTDRRKRDVLSPDPLNSTRYELKVLGDPTLQLGRRVSIGRGGAGGLRLAAVRHIFDLRSGYVCEIVAVDEKIADPEGLGGPDGVVDGVGRLIRDTMTDRPAVEVGDVSLYRKAGEGEHGGHRATLHYGQKPDPNAVSASVDGAVDQTLLLHEKPLSSPFAWDRCGLVVPVYEGMRAVLVHNRGQVNDALGTGFVWSRQARHEPPKNEPGDYWLCLPTEVADGRPKGKGANDLTDKSGHRAIGAAGLSITVGKDKLPEVGTRPEVPEASTFTIEHDQGTKITIAADGSVTVQTDGKDITMGNGQASISISGGSITLDAQSIKLTAPSVEVG